MTKLTYNPAEKQGVPKLLVVLAQHLFVFASAR